MRASPRGFAHAESLAIEGGRQTQDRHQRCHRPHRTTNITRRYQDHPGGLSRGTDLHSLRAPASDTGGRGHACSCGQARQGESPRLLRAQTRKLSAAAPAACGARARRQHLSRRQASSRSRARAQSRERGLRGVHRRPLASVRAGFLGGDGGRGPDVPVRRERPARAAAAAAKDAAGSARRSLPRPRLDAARSRLLQEGSRAVLRVPLGGLLPRAHRGEGRARQLSACRRDGGGAGRDEGGLHASGLSQVAPFIVARSNFGPCTASVRGLFACRKTCPQAVQLRLKP